jgi:hypothetical protein
VGDLHRGKGRSVGAGRGVVQGWHVQLAACAASCNV